MKLQWNFFLISSIGIKHLIKYYYYSTYMHIHVCTYKYILSNELFLLIPVLCTYLNLELAVASIGNYD